MSAVGLAFYFVFGGNLLLEWGLPGYKPVEQGRTIQNAALLMVVSVLSTLIHGMLFRHLLMPFGLETMIPFAFAIILFGLHAVIRLAFKFSAKQGTPATGYPDTILLMSLVLYAAAMSTARMVASLSLLVLGGLAATSGYLASSVLLDEIVNRLNLEPVPEAFKGIPIRLVSAGLIALTFAGIEAAFLMKMT